MITIYADDKSQQWPDLQRYLNIKLIKNIM